jgi:hypothetical protein
MTQPTPDPDERDVIDPDADVVDPDEFPDADDEPPPVPEDLTRVNPAIMSDT